jgi:hypothetical protein
VENPDGHVLIPFVSRRRERAQLLQKMQHAIPAVALLIAGAQGVMHGERGLGLALAVFELAVSVLLLRTLKKEIAAVRSPHPVHSVHGAAHPGHHHGVDWFDIFAAGVLTAEALEHWYTHHHLSGPTLLTAAVTLLLGLFHGRLSQRQARRRSLRIDDFGIRIRGRFFRRFAAPWSDIERIELDDRRARIVARGGRQRRINLKDLRNAEEVREALLAARGRVIFSE